MGSPGDHPADGEPLSFWQLKPWWCQPWSILLTGTVLMTLAGLAHQRFAVPLWIVLPFVLAILGWWLLFLVVVPASYASSQHP
ncbi:MAG: DUF6737 family protein [Cyanobacteriota bacterium]|nr:DUF6737 family protein [Cyanobacteriota bacterium]